MKVIRKIIEIDEERCDGCGACVLSCAEGAIEIVEGKAKVLSDKYCDGLGACIGECPQDALHLVDRKADEFDEDAVEKHLQTKKTQATPELAPLGCGCPSTRVESFAPTEACREANEPATHQGTGSALSHWPVQIRLVPPKASFLKNADLLVTADCVPVAYPDFHQAFLRGKVVMMGCPKFDDVQAYVEKFTEIFRMADIRNVTVLEMEVPCCSALPMIVRKGMEAAERDIPYLEQVITTRGKILKKDRHSAGRFDEVASSPGGRKNPSRG